MKGTSRHGRPETRRPDEGNRKLSPGFTAGGRSFGRLAKLRLPQPGPLTLLSMVKVALETDSGSRIALGLILGWVG